MRLFESLLLPAIRFHVLGLNMLKPHHSEKNCTLIFGIENLITVDKFSEFKPADNILICNCMSNCFARRDRHVFLILVSTVPFCAPCTKQITNFVVLLFN